ncbi:MAG: MFS transporter [Pelagimonas sp.]|jgi:MFS family permease|nr:MFS transporter [Pelagimonas sp.]
MKQDIWISKGPLAAFMIVGLYWGVFGALVPDVKAMADLSDGAFGTAMLISTCGALVSMYLAPKVSRGLGRWALTMMSLALIAAFLLPGLTSVWIWFALAMALAAMASGLLDVTMNAQLSVLESSSGRSLMNLNHGMFSVAYALAAIGTGFAREAGLSPFQVFCGAGVVALALLIVVHANPVAPSDTPEEGAAQATSLPWTLVLPAGLALLIAFLSEQGTEGWSALHLERGLGAGEAQGSLGPAILGITMAIGRLSGQVVIQRFDEVRLLRAAACVSALGALIAAWAPSIGIAYLGFALLGLGVSVIVPIGLGIVGRSVRDDQKALAISRVTMVGYTGFFIGPPMMGFLAELMGLPMSFTAVALLLIMVPLVLLPMMAKRMV